MHKFGNWLRKSWNICSGTCFLLSAALLLFLLLNVPQGAGAAPIPPSNTDAPTSAPQIIPALGDFTIVARQDDMETANALAVEFKLKYDVSLKVVEDGKFTGNYGIYIDTADFNTYGGYKYSISWEQTEDTAALYVDGSGEGLATAVSKLLKGIKDADAFPFGLEQSTIGYEWNTDDVNLTALGFGINELNKRELHTGVELWEMKYKSFAYGKVTAYAVVVKADADAQLKVMAADWNETHNADNPAPKHTVQQYSQMLADQGYEVLAISNAGFYDLNTTKTNLPLGMQIVDGVVRHEPSTDNPKNTDNWFGMNNKGDYVISNTEGYDSTYEGTIAQGVGGGLILMKDGVPTLSSTGVDFRTVVGVTKNGDMILLCMPNANYAVVVQTLMDMDLDIDKILNLDGGGSTTLHTLTEDGKLDRFVCETPIEREVADSIAIVKKK